MERWIVCVCDSGVIISTILGQYLSRRLCISILVYPISIWIKIPNLKAYKRKLPAVYRLSVIKVSIVVTNTALSDNYLYFGHGDAKGDGCAS